MRENGSLNGAVTVKVMRGVCILNAEQAEYAALHWMRSLRSLRERVKDAFTHVDLSK